PARAAAGPPAGARRAARPPARPAPGPAAEPLRVAELPARLPPPPSTETLRVAELPARLPPPPSTETLRVASLPVPVRRRPRSPGRAAVPLRDLRTQEASGRRAPGHPRAPAPARRAARRGPSVKYTGSGQVLGDRPAAARPGRALSKIETQSDDPPTSGDRAGQVR